MKSLLDVLTLGRDRFAKEGFSHPRREAEEMLSYALEKPRLELYLYHDRPLTEQELTCCRNYLKRRLKHEPVQYIRGSVPFLDCTIACDARALIPRLETELMVENVIKKAQPKVIFDLCTGSGCIAIALKKAFPEAQVYASDLSQDALQLAKENGQRNGVDITFLQGDLFTPFSCMADLIISNPPYVAEDEFSKLDPDVRRFEPKEALLAGPRGLDFYRRIALEYSKYLEKEGLVCLEIGSLQKEAIDALFMPHFSSRTCCLDLAGLPRFFFLENE